MLLEEAELPEEVEGRPELARDAGDEVADDGLVDVGGRDGSRVEEEDGVLARRVPQQALQCCLPLCHLLPHFLIVICYHDLVQQAYCPLQLARSDSPPNCGAGSSPPFGMSSSPSIGAFALTSSIATTGCTWHNKRTLFSFFS